MDLGLKGKNAIIVGGARGIGRAAAEILASEGANVAICARDQKNVDQAVASLSAKGIKATGAAVDVTDGDAYRAWVTAAGEELGGIDIFIGMASAGGGVMDESGWRANLETDIFGTTRGVVAAMHCNEGRTDYLGCPVEPVTGHRRYPREHGIPWSNVF